MLRRSVREQDEWIDFYPGKTVDDLHKAYKDGSLFGLEVSSPLHYEFMVWSFFHTRCTISWHC